MRKSIEIYDDNAKCLISGEFRLVQELDTGTQLGFFESAEYPKMLVVLVLYPDGTYFFAERLEGMGMQDGCTQGHLIPLIDRESIKPTA